MHISVDVERSEGWDDRGQESRANPVPLIKGQSLKFQGFRVSGFRVQCSGFRVQGSGFWVRGSGFRVQGSRVSGFRVQG